MINVHFFSLERTPGKIEDLTDLLLEDWRKLGNVRELGKDTLKFIRLEMERSWGDKKLAVFSEEEAQKWVLGVRIWLNDHFEHLRRTC